MPFSPTEADAAKTVAVTMPETGSAAEARLDGWQRRAGDEVQEAETLCLVSWDGFTAEVDSPASGLLTVLVVSEGQPISVGDTLAMIEVPVDVPPEATAPPGPEPAPEAEVAFEPEPEFDPEAVPEPESVQEPPPAAAPPPPEPAGPDPVPVGLVRDAPVADREPVDLSGFLSPAVRRAAARHGIDPETLRGTGRGGRVTLSDVRAAAAHTGNPAAGA